MPPPTKPKVTSVTPSLTSPPSICKYCKFWVKKSMTLGECHCEPPKILVGKLNEHGLTGCFPITDDTSWCGQFKSP